MDEEGVTTGAEEGDIEVEEEGVTTGAEEGKIEQRQGKRKRKAQSLGRAACGLFCSLSSAPHFLLRVRLDLSSSRFRRRA